eukprot:114363_1
MTQQQAMLEQLETKYAKSCAYSSGCHAFQIANQLHAELQKESESNLVQKYVLSLKYTALISDLFDSNIWKNNKYLIQVRANKHKFITITKEMESIRSKILTQSESFTQKAATCRVCLQPMELSDIAKVNSCGHIYHGKCIKSWSHIENSCPLCKRKFKYIYMISTGIETKIPEKQQQAENEMNAFVWENCVCSYCGSNDDEHLLLLCDGCDDAAHTYCAGFGHIVPSADYFCNECGNSNLSDKDYVPSL